MTQEQINNADDLIAEAIQYSPETEAFADERLRIGNTLGEEEEEVTVELRSNGEKTAWCVIAEGKIFPFGSDNLGKECAEWAARKGYLCENYAVDPSYTTVIYDGK